MKTKLSLTHYLFPVFCILVALVFQYSGLDIRIESYFYDYEFHYWPYRETFLTEEVLHKGARALIAMMFIGVLLIFLISFINVKFQYYRRSTGYILLAGLSGVLIVGILKGITHMYTPWDINNFGGMYPNIRVFDHVSANLPVGHAFPAGHASAGYALLSFYFLSRYLEFPGYRVILTGALVTGLILGVDQQIRGAHMMSHDLFTLAICWFSCLFWSAVLLSKNDDTNFKMKEALRMSTSQDNTNFQ